MFTRKLIERLLVAFLTGFGAVAIPAAGENWSMSALGGAVAAGLRLVYALAVKEVGESGSPDVR